MSRRFIFCFMMLLALALSGCGGGTEGANDGLDRPKAPKKEKDK